MIHLIAEFFLNFSCILMFFFPFIVKPNITTFKSDPVIAIFNQSVKITCKAKGLPAPTYFVYHNGTKKLTGVVNGEKTIELVKQSDAGEYRCKASNILGNDIWNFNLTVHGKIYSNLYLFIYFI